MRVSAQLYTVRQCGGLRDQLQLAAACGYGDVETTGLHKLSAPEMVKIVRQSGMTLRSAHFDWEEFEGRFSEIIEVLNLLECPVAVMPWLAPGVRPDTVRGWMAVSGRLSEWSDRLAQHGVKLAFHNHDFDLVGYPDQTPLDMILAQGNVFWQPDIGWLVAAGLDPAYLIRRYSGQILSIHAKDVDPTKRGDARWQDVGDGVVNWETVLRALANTNCTDLFVEHDETPDHRRTLEVGHRFLTEQLSEIA